MMRSVLFVLSFLCAVVFTGCATHQINHHQLSALNKNMPREDVLKRFEKAPIATGEVSINGRTILFDRFLMNNGVQSDWYFLAYETNRLLYWGYASEFRKLSDLFLNQVIDEGMRVTVPKK